tara:strand:+ start:183 stop:2156 length:1974 start_codon:yes stop_codon:yes gene_type:complete
MVKRRRNNELEANAVSLSELFEEGIFTIPKYQRTYEWEAVNVAELLEDMLDPNNTEEQKYFIGPIMLTSGKERNTFEVVDGQQRLMTNYLFLGRIAAFYKKFIDFNYEDDEGYAEREQKLEDLIELLVPEQKRKKEPKTRIIPSALDAQEFNMATDEIYERCISYIAEIDDLRSLHVTEHELPDYGRFMTNDDTIKEFLEGKLGYKYKDTTKFDEKKRNEVDETFNKILNYTQCVEVIEIILADYQDPIQIFNSLNSEGMELSDFDLVRSTFFDFFDENTSDKQETDFYVKDWLVFETNFFEEYNQKFPNATPNLRKKHKDGFLKNYLILKNRDFKSSNIHTEMRELCKENISSHEDKIVDGLKATVQDMTRFAVSYNIITTGNLPKEHQKFLDKRQNENRFNKDKRRFLKSVQSIHLYKPQAACNAYLMRLIEEGLSIESDQDYNKLNNIKTSLNIFESYTIRRHFMHSDSSPKNLFEPLAKNDRFWDSKVFKEMLLENSSQRPFFTNKKLNDYINNQESPASDKGLKSLKYFLFEYEKHVRGESVDTVSIEDLELEHICPVSYMENWSDVMSEENKPWIQTIGNFTLISDKINKQVSNQKFVNKLERYKQSANRTMAPREITKGLKKWGVEEIRANRLKMKLFLFDNWRDLDQFE